MSFLQGPPPKKKRKKERKRSTKKKKRDGCSLDCPLKPQKQGTLKKRSTPALQAKQMQLELKKEQQSYQQERWRELFRRTSARAWRFFRDAFRSPKAMVGLVFDSNRWASGVKRAQELTMIKILYLGIQVLFLVFGRCGKCWGPYLALSNLAVVRENCQELKEKAVREQEMQNLTALLAGKDKAPALRVAFKSLWRRGGWRSSLGEPAPYDAKAPSRSGEILDSWFELIGVTRR